MSRTLVRARRAAWYHKPLPTFADGLALVRRELRAQANFRLSASEPDMVKVLRTFIEQLTETLCYAA